MDPLLQIQRAIEIRHRCRAEYVRTVAVCETANNGIVWDGNVDVFRVEHSHATRCYAWIAPMPRAEPVIVTILGIAPVVSPRTAVRSVLARTRGG